MKKILLIVFSALLLIGCNKSKDNELKVGATPVPHAQILEFIKPLLKQEGIELKIVSYTDYVTPNLALEDGSIDANFFQHIPYLEKNNRDRNLHLVSVGKVHLEPLGIYSQKLQALQDLKPKSTVAIPNDPSNLARALILLHNKKIITLKDPKNLLATQQDITSNPKNLVFKPLEAALLTKVLPDVELAIINGNYALQANLKNPIAQEDERSPYANVVAVKQSNQDSPKIKALMKALQSDKTKDFILTNYKGEVIPAF